MRLVIGICAGVFAIASSHAGTMFFQSGEKQTALIELYTSEGCSSCPPAEAWLSKLKSDPRLWKDFVPLAFHVDYWDRLGWRDRFASREWTERQSTYAASLRSGSVYTPEFVRNGEEWHDWFRSSEIVKSESKNVGTLSATTNDNKTFSIAYRGAADVPFEAHVVLLACGITSKIGAGENRGRQLQHDFVVIAHRSAPMWNDSGTAHAAVTLNSLGEQNAQEAIAIWISRANQVAPVQATGGWLGKIALQK